MYDKILLPTDGSEGAEKALEHALSLAEKYDAEILFLNVVDVRAQNTMDMWADVLGHMEESGKELTRDMVDRADEKSVEAEAEVVRGVPSREIVSRTEDDVDLVVMGTHGRTGLDRILVGSVAEKVVRTSEVPVMTVGRKG